MSEVRLSEIVAALSHALDLTEGQAEGHASRTCLIGLRLATDLGLSSADRAALYYALLLKDSGCSSSSARLSSLFGADDIALKRSGKLVDWTRPREALAYCYRSIPSGSPLSRARRALEVALELARDDGIVDARCERGARIVHDLGFPPAAAEAVRHLDEHWDGRGRPAGVAGEDIPVLARIACLAQTAEVFLTVRGRDVAREMVLRRRGRWFDPGVADAFLAIPDDDGLWEAVAAAADPAHVAAHEPQALAVAEDEGSVDRIAEAFAQVIDAKSSYTYDHSLRVAGFAVAIGREMGLGDDDLRCLRHAGLLHDIGKLGTSSAILDKPGRLTDEEFAVVRRHPADGERILEQVGVFRRIAPLAGAHHERLDGGGYPRGLQGAEIPPLARILTVADVYEALTADRPYRGPIPPAEALAIMSRDAGAGLCTETLDAHRAAVERGATPAAV